MLRRGNLLRARARSTVLSKRRFLGMAVEYTARNAVWPRVRMIGAVRPVVHYMNVLRTRVGQVVQGVAFAVPVAAMVVVVVEGPLVVVWVLLPVLAVILVVALLMAVAPRHRAR